MFLSVEVRWFGWGPVPPDVERWFQVCPGQAAAYPPRTDHYLRGTGPALGVKLREGRLEVKPRLGDEGTLRPRARLAGRVERWAKWSFPLAAGEGDDLASVADSPQWVAVRKTRALRAYRVAAGDGLVPAPPGQVPGQSCTLELTRVDVAGQSWWTVGFESGGDGPGLRARLDAVVAHLVGAADPPSLPARDSFGYAAWLDREI